MDGQNLSEKTLYDLGDQQQAILEAVWEGRGATVRQVWGKLSPDRKLAYTSILSAMQKLEKMGWLRHEAVANRYVYHVVLSRDEAALLATRKFIVRVYRGDPASLVRQLSGQALRPAAPKPSLKTLLDLRRRVR